MPGHKSQASIENWTCRNTDVKNQVELGIRAESRPKLERQTEIIDGGSNRARQGQKWGCSQGMEALLGETRGVGGAGAHLERDCRRAEGRAGKPESREERTWASDSALGRVLGICVLPGTAHLEPAGERDRSAQAFVCSSERYSGRASTGATAAIFRNLTTYNFVEFAFK